MMDDDGDGSLYGVESGDLGMNLRLVPFTPRLAYAERTTTVWSNLRKPGNMKLQWIQIVKLQTVKLRWIQIERVC